MRVHYLPLIVACGLCLLAVPQATTPTGPQPTAAQIDFDGLRVQASTALEALRQSHERRLASVAGAAF